ncbi:MAG: DEAD/DEAH box helicase [Rhodocyclaceae bacterium]|jgi:ATP-dependent RNA helicase RhlE|nr:DEAD/DEAH box helicase [Rhodocyclaceae bacterium]
MIFSELGLRAEILRSLAEQGYDTPTPIQQQAIPEVLAGHDLMAAAQTGTGKTAGFTLPMLQLLSTRSSGLSMTKFQTRALILTPTRELAAQVYESVRTYGKHLNLRAAAIYGGVSMVPQTKLLRAGVEIIVATPGRLLDHIAQRNVDLSNVEIVVLDEADRMLDMGFLPDIKKVMKTLPEKRQTLMYSATFSDEIRQLAKQFLNEPRQVAVASANSTADTVAQAVYTVDRSKKRDLLVKLIEDNQWHQVLVFTRTKHGANALAEKLDKGGIRAAAIHGNKSQGARTKALADFKSLKLHVLVATDIAARGIDIDQLPHVVNYELPNVPEDYVHRIGRTGRAGATGEAVSLVCVDEFKLLRDIERLLKRQLEKRVVEGFEPDPNAKPQPIENGRRSFGGGDRDSRPPRQGQGQGEARKPQGDNRSRGEGRSNAARNASSWGNKPQPNGGGARRSGPPRQGAGGAGRSDGQRSDGGFRQR